MQYTDKDIEIFIFTRNRPQMCIQAVESVLAQKAACDFYLLDNSTDDKTQELIKNYPQVKYIRTQPDKPFANFIMAQNLMSKPYTMILHDDDLIHPQYLGLALKALTKYRDISFISAKSFCFYTNIPPKEYTMPRSLNDKHYLIDNQADFALGFWTSPSPSWSGSIIKSEFYKNADISLLQKKFGKIFDWPMMIETMKAGKAIIFADGNCIFYRLHKGQDSFNESTSISIEHLTNWLKVYKHFSETNDYLRKVYFFQSVGNAITNHTKFVSKKAKEKLPPEKLIRYLTDNNIITPKMALYYKYRKNVFAKIFFHYIKKQYRNYYNKMIKKI